MIQCVYVMKVTQGKTVRYFHVENSLQFCKTCDSGYMNIGEGVLLCVSVNTCGQDTCGCDYSAGSCQPLGT